MAKTPATAFSEHARKDIIRKLWCKPQIEFLHKQLKKKLIYIGLPDLGALDVLEWIDYLDKVIAFQCSEYIPGVKIDVSRLIKLLETLERQNKLKSSFVYQGFMEEIIMGGMSENGGQTYSQNDFMKVYNLDFCSNLKYPLEIVTAKGKKTKSIHKTDVIDKLLEFQKALEAEKGKKFIMYITVNTNFFIGDLDDIKEAYIKEYYKTVKSKTTKSEVLTTRQLKAYCFHTLTEIFKKHDFHVEFLPPVFYLGSENKKATREKKKVQLHRMMTFTVLGTKREGKEELFKQDGKEFLDKKFIYATDNNLACFDDVIEETKYKPDTLDILKNSYTYKNLWLVK